MGHCFVCYLHVLWVHVHTKMRACTDKGHRQMLGTLPGIQLFISIITKLFTSESSSEYSWRIQRHVQDCIELYSLHYHRAIPQPMTHQMPASLEAVRNSSVFLGFPAVIHCLISNWSPVWPSLTVLLTWPPNALQTCATTFGFLLFK